MRGLVGGVEVEEPAGRGDRGGILPASALAVGQQPQHRAVAVAQAIAQGAQPVIVEVGQQVAAVERQALLGQGLCAARQEAAGRLLEGQRVHPQRESRGQP